jgi:hypothetical protein
MAFIIGRISSDIPYQCRASTGAGGMTAFSRAGQNEAMKMELSLWIAVMQFTRARNSRRKLIW